ncbi:protein PXR1-like [Mangifera indica]|uniref:protein PXR1-like n=1 Tax=Mangifera indica TaxID=29780 RepID=UPI001CFB7420|nr:protein PXR1-like [Mangifera indica]
MKTITGQVLSTSQISLSKAASTLSKFVNADTNASPALCAYLRRASVSFIELSQLHKELKSGRKHKTSKSDIIAEEEKPTRSVLSNQLPSHPELRESSHGVSNGIESKIKKEKKEKRERSEFVNVNGVLEVEEKTAKKKKRKIGEIEEGQAIHSEESPIKKKKKRKTEEHS